MYVDSLLGLLCRLPFFEEIIAMGSLGLGSECLVGQKHSDWESETHMFPVGPHRVVTCWHVAGSLGRLGVDGQAVGGGR